MQRSPFTNFPVGIVPDAKCRVGITLDVEKRKSTYKDDWPHAGNFKGSLSHTTCAARCCAVCNIVCKGMRLRVRL